MNTIDERVVEMRFNNERFERNVHTSISTLDKLKSALKLDGATKGLSQVESYSNRLNFGGLTSAVENISSKFSAMGILGVTILQRLANQAVTTGERFVKALTVDQINAGWAKYADKTSSVQTIMAATESTWEQSAKAVGHVGSQMEFVNAQMDKLNWFTDETSYNFVDMVSNIGKFTANNIPLEDAVTSMQGIANWAAISGQSAAAASRAMYNLSQALGVGSVKLMDWRSIENANMATSEFKSKVLEVAVANGQLTQSVDSTGKVIYKTIKGTEVGIENFSQSLSEGWFDKNTLIGVLDQYGSFTNQLYEFSQASGLTATEILELVDANAKGTLSQEAYAKALKDSGMSSEEFKSTLDKLGSEENEFGRKTFAAAQMAKTFAEAVDATRDAASTKWMNIFENIFGDYEKAKVLWTGFANFLYDTLVSPLETIEEISEYLEQWDAITMVINSFKDFSTFLGGDSTNGINGILGSLREGFEKVIPPIEITSSMVGSALYRFRKFAASLSLNSTAMEKLQKIGNAVAKVLLFFGNTLKNIWTDIQPFIQAVGILAESLFNLIARVSGLSDDMDTSGLKIELFSTIVEKLADFIKGLAKSIDKLDTEKIKTFFSSIQGAFSGIGSIFSWLNNVLKKIDFASAIGSAIDWIQGKIQILREYLSGIDFGEAFKNGAGIGILTLIGTGLAKLIHNFNKPLLDFDKFKEKIGDILDGVKNAITTFQNGVKADMLQKIAIAIGILAASLFILGLVNYDKAIYGVSIIAIAMVALIAALTNIGKINSKIAVLAGSLVAIAIAFAIFSVSLLILAGAVAAFALVAKMDTAWEGLALLVGVLLLVVAAMAVLSELSVKIIVSAVALSIFAASLLILAGAIAAFALIAKMDNISEGFGMFAASLLLVTGVLTILSFLSPKVILSAAALFIVSSAMLVLAAAIGAITLAASSENFGSALAGLILMLVVLTAALIALGAAGPMVLVGAAALFVAAAACLVLSIAVAAAGLALPLLAIGLEALGNGIESNISSISSGIVTFGEALQLLITSVGEGIAAAVSALIASFGEGIGKGLEAISAGIDKIGDSIGNVGTGIENFGNGVRSLDGVPWTSAAIGIGEMAGALKNLKKSITSEELNGIADGLTNVCISISETLLTFSSEFSEDGSQLAKVFGTAYISGIKSMTQPSANAARNLASASYSASYAYSGFYSTGANSAAGYIQGILSQTGRAEEAGRTLAERALKAAKEALDVGSPSKEFRKIGRFSGEGYAIGVKDTYNIVDKSISDMAYRSVNTAKLALSHISTLLNSDLDSAPTITPVLDLSQIQNGSKVIGALMNGNRSLSITGSIARASKISGQFETNEQMPTNNDGTNMTNGANFTFTQNNYSPKALSRADIYRQTKNQFSALKEAVTIHA